VNQTLEDLEGMQKSGGQGTPTQIGTRNEFDENMQTVRDNIISIMANLKGSSSSSEIGKLQELEVKLVQSICQEWGSDQLPQGPDDFVISDTIVKEGLYHEYPTIRNEIKNIIEGNNLQYAVERTVFQRYCYMILCQVVKQYPTKYGKDFVPPSMEERRYGGLVQDKDDNNNQDRSGSSPDPPSSPTPSDRAAEELADKEAELKHVRGVIAQQKALLERQNEVIKEKDAVLASLGKGNINNLPIHQLAANTTIATNVPVTQTVAPLTVNPQLLFQQQQSHLLSQQAGGSGVLNAINQYHIPQNSAGNQVQEMMARLLGVYSLASSQPVPNINTSGAGTIAIPLQLRHLLGNHGSNLSNPAGGSNNYGMASTNIINGGGAPPPPPPGGGSGNSGGNGVPPPNPPGMGNGLAGVPMTNGVLNHNGAPIVVRNGNPNPAEIQNLRPYHGPNSETYYNSAEQFIKEFRRATQFTYKTDEELIGALRTKLAGFAAQWFDRLGSSSTTYFDDVIEELLKMGRRLSYTIKSYVSKRRRIM
jgi:hypothetical protein